MAGHPWNANAFRSAVFAANAVDLVDADRIPGRGAAIRIDGVNLSHAGVAIR